MAEAGSVCSGGFEGELRGGGGGLGDGEGVDLVGTEMEGPGGQADHRGAGAEGEGDLGEGAEAAADGDHGVAGADQEEVPVGTEMVR